MTDARHSRQTWRDERERDILLAIGANIFSGAKAMNRLSLRRSVQNATIYQILILLRLTVPSEV